MGDVYVRRAVLVGQFHEAQSFVAIGRISNAAVTGRFPSAFEGEISQFDERLDCRTCFSIPIRDHDGRNPCR